MWLLEAKRPSGTLLCSGGIYLLYSGGAMVLCTATQDDSSTTTQVFQIVHLMLIVPVYGNRENNWIYIRLFYQLNDNRLGLGII